MTGFSLRRRRSPTVYGLTSRRSFVAYLYVGFPKCHVVCRARTTRSNDLDPGLLTQRPELTSVLGAAGL
jgi:hypothetical protein